MFPSSGKDYTKRLPAELLSAVLNELEQPAVLAGARICRRWRDVATRHGNFYAFLRLKNNYNMNNDSEVAAFRAALHEILSRGMCVKLDVRIPNPTPGNEDAPRQLLRAVSDSLPLLVAMSLGVAQDMCPDTIRSLRRTTPRLRALVLKFDALTSIPVDFLGAAAPKLRSFVLSGGALPDERCPALHGVASLVMHSDYNLGGSHRLDVHFPNLSLLSWSLLLHPSIDTGLAIPRLCSSLRTLYLSVLYPKNDWPGPVEDFFSSLTVPNVSITFAGERFPPLSAFLTTLSAPLEVQLCPQLRVLIRSRATGHLRQFAIRPRMFAPVLKQVNTALASRITHLRVELPLVTGAAEAPPRSTTNGLAAETASAQPGDVDWAALVFSPDVSLSWPSLRTLTVEGDERRATVVSASQMLTVVAALQLSAAVAKIVLRLKHVDIEPATDAEVLRGIFQQVDRKATSAHER